MPVSHWQLRNESLPLADGPRLMGIVNVTPDSFSDGGQFLCPEDAVSHGVALVAAGADVLDIGGESTRPYAPPVAENEELDRVIPVVEALANRVTVPISIDTSKPAVARAAIAAGAQIINDVSGFRDEAMIEVAAATEAAVCAMHMQGTPQTMQDRPQYQNVLSDVLDYLRNCREKLTAAGIDPSRICLDPGIGFGKTHKHNLILVKNVARLRELNAPILVGHSRKGFIKKITGDPSAEQVPGSIATTLWLALQGVHLIRVHDIRLMRHALSMWQAIANPQEASVE